MPIPTVTHAHRALEVPAGTASPSRDSERRATQLSSVLIGDFYSPPDTPTGPEIAEIEVPATTSPVMRVTKLHQYQRFGINNLILSYS